MSLSAPSNGPAAGRNTLTQDFLDCGDEWLLWLDDDMGFAPDTVDRLLSVANETTHPIVGALCFSLRELGLDGLGGFHCVVRPTIYEWTEQGDSKQFAAQTDYAPDTVIPVAATGSACILIHRTVIETLLNRHDEDPQFGKPYDPIRGSGGNLLGEDISFCVRATSCDRPIHVHTGVQTNHMKSIWVSEHSYESERILTQTMMEVSA